MNTATKPETSVLQVLDASQDNPATSSATLILRGDAMERIFKFADMMAQGVATVPKHLQGKPADCLAIVMQATQWGMNPFAVAQKTYLVGGTLGYEAQLVNAVLQATNAVKGGFSYEYRNAGEAMECRVGATPAGANTITWGEWLSIGLVTTKNSPLWKTNPKQQMGYLQVKNWARAFKPAAILGVYTTDELEEIPAPKNMGMAEVVPPAKPETYPQEQFDMNLPAWQKVIVSGRKTADQIISMAQTKHPLTDEQKAAIRESVKSDHVTDAAPKITYANVADRLYAATDVDALNDAATLIGEVSAPDQRTDLTAIYDKRVSELAQ